MKPYLPAQDPNLAERNATLVRQRQLYEYDRTYLPDLPLLKTVPKVEDFSIRYITERLAATAELPVNMLASKTRSFLDPLDDLQDYEDLFTVLPLPKVAKIYQTDRSFAEQRLMGANPMMLRVLTSDMTFPSELKTLPILNFQQELAANNIFVADYSGNAPYYTGPAKIQGNTHEKGRKYLPKPRAYFWWRWTGVRDRGELVPLAVELKFNDPDPQSFLTPFSSSSTDWLYAKLCVQIADANQHEMSTHLGRTHLVMEPIAIATARHLADNHPLSLLLRPHFRFLLANNHLARNGLINSGGFVDKLLSGTLAESLSLVKEACQTWSIRQFALPTEIKNRGMDTLPHYPYRDDGQLIWDAIHRYVEGYLGYFYKEASLIGNDEELKAWSQELADPNQGNVPDMPAQITDLMTLVEIVTTIIFICGPQHSAVNYPQYDYMAFAANMPLAAYQDPTFAKNTDEKRLLSLLPPYQRAAEQLEILFGLSAYHYDQLGFYDKSFQELYQMSFEQVFEGTPIEVLNPTFQQELYAAEQKIEDRNQRRVTPYLSLKPSLILNSISI